MHVLFLSCFQIPTPGTVAYWGLLLRLGLEFVTNYCLNPIKEVHKCPFVSKMALISLSQLPLNYFYKIQPRDLNIVCNALLQEFSSTVAT